MHEMVGQPSNYPRTDETANNLRRVAGGMQLLFTSAIFCALLTALCPLTMYWQTGTLMPPGRMEGSIAYYFGLTAACAFLPTLITLTIIFVALRSIGSGLGWSKSSPLLISLGILASSIACGGIGFYIGIIVTVNRGLAGLGAPNWSSITPAKLIHYSNTLHKKEF